MDGHKQISKKASGTQNKPTKKQTGKEREKKQASIKASRQKNSQIKDILAKTGWQKSNRAKNGQTIKEADQKARGQKPGGPKSK